MKTEMCEVKSGGTIVATVDVEEFESISEAQENLGDSEVLSLINTQHATKKKNQARQEATATVSKGKLKEMSTAELISSDMDKLTAVAGDHAAIAALIEEKMKEIEARMAAQRPLATTTDPDEE